MILKEDKERYLSDSVKLVNEMSAGKEMIFDTPVIIKSSPHTHVFTIYGVYVLNDKCYLLDGGGNWHGPLKADQHNAEYVITSLHQRLKSIKYALSKG